MTTPQVAYARSLQAVLAGRLPSANQDSVALVADVGSARLSFSGTTAARAADTLVGDEPAAVAAALPARAQEFATGRWCARRALAGLGLDGRQEIPVGPHREPVWPVGINGSLSHTRGFVAAMVATGTDGVGIDVERTDHVLGDAEWRFISTGETAPSMVDRLTIFSAKEAFFKLVFARVGRAFGFRACRVTLAEPLRGLAIEVLEDLSPSVRAGRSFEGNYVLFSDFVLSWLCHERGSCP
jgi:enterobactin synthetase component D